MCQTLCDPMDCSLPGSSVHGIFQVRILEWVAISFSRGSTRPRHWTLVSCIVGRHNWATSLLYFTCVYIYLWSAVSWGFSVLGIFLGRILEWVAISFSRGSTWPRDQNPVCHNAGRFFTVWATKTPIETHSLSRLKNQRTELGANIATESEREILGKRDTERGNPKFCVKTLVKCVAEPWAINMSYRGIKVEEIF